jgi:hypothetical protein
MTPEKTFEEQLDEMEATAQKSKEFVPLDSIGAEMRLKWLLEEFKKDKQGNSCLFVVFATEDQRKVKQKYTATMIGELRSSIQAVGTKEQLEKEFFLYRKKEVGKRGSFARLYPVPSEAPKRKK